MKTYYIYSGIVNVTIGYGGRCPSAHSAKPHWTWSRKLDLTSIGFSFNTWPLVIIVNAPSIRLGLVTNLWGRPTHPLEQHPSGMSVKHLPKILSSFDQVFHVFLTVTVVDRLWQPLEGYSPWVCMLPLPSRFLVRIRYWTLFIGLQRYITTYLHTKKPQAWHTDHHMPVRIARSSYQYWLGRCGILLLIPVQYKTTYQTQS